MVKLATDGREIDDGSWLAGARRYQDDDQDLLPKQLTFAWCRRGRLEITDGMLDLERGGE